MDFTELKQAQSDLDDANMALATAITRRDESIHRARNSGASAIEIAEASGITRQQVHRIIDKAVSPTLAALRMEVIQTDAPYEALIDDDKAHVDDMVHHLAKERGITL